MKRIEVLGLETIPKIQDGDDLAQIIADSAQKEIAGLKEKDIVVLTSKIVSKAHGLTIKMDDVIPGKRAKYISRKTGKDAQWLQMIFDEGHEIVAIMPLRGLMEKHIFNASRDAACAEELVEHEQAVCITRSKDGRIHTCDAGIDSSNHEKGVLSLLPKDPDASAKQIRGELEEIAGVKLAVVLADTEMIPFGTMDFAIGSSGIAPVSKLFGQKDIYGKPKFGGMDLTVHEICSACALVFGQAGAGVPAAIIRGYDYQIDENANIKNTILAGSENAAQAIRETIIATSYVHGPVKRILMKIAA